MCKKDYIWNRPTSGCENGKYSSSVTEDSVIVFDETIDTTETILTKTVRAKGTSTNFYTLHGFLLITIALLIAVSIYCYLRKCQRKQKYLLPHHDINNKLKKFYINKCIINVESNDKLKEINIKNSACYYFDDIIKLGDFDLYNISIDEKLYENILVYNISYKILVGDKSLRITFHKIDGFITVHYGRRYLVLFAA